MKFYMTPGSCSTGIHILLEEVEVVFEAYLVNLLRGDQFKPEYLAINPRATIPTLVCDDGTALTEFQSIAWWIGRQYPRYRLIPESAEGQARVHEVMRHISHTLHGEGFARIFTTERFADTPAEAEKARALGLRVIDKGFAQVEPWLAGNDYVAGPFSIADCALFYVEFWADRSAIALPENCQAHYRRMLRRRAVRQVLAEEGYAAVLRATP